ncbi:hypothetical protein LNKW23_08140 [Paralimibaculum aggregatum]|uniref:Uncharacterized protein n=1 Tax=Paralimibaculum aggregatum TaxID=3036245 RepID=A0ABQ6LE30_9RHOB|nr:hypothetical protein [Limibaculum sp. NKW23]GMG81601.1 hypothetical protein LNKW23_08140 [Limibaculum sp. NKW23]
MIDAMMFEGLKKMPERPGLAVMKATNTKLETRLTVDPRASIGELLQALEGQRGLSLSAEVDMLKVLSHTLPPREAVWWSCLSARDVVGHGETLTEGPLFAAESWVFKPSDENRRKAFEATQKAPQDDPSILAALGAVYASGTYGPDDLEDMEVPPGIFGNVVFGQVLASLDVAGDVDGLVWMGMLIERGLDIAKGGNGKAIPVPEPEPEPAE